jgi:CspA family cold shock protein
MIVGIVKSFNEDKGFGFICDAGTGQQYLVHASGLTTKIKEGDHVVFNLVKGKKGITAVNVKLI